MPEAVYGDWSAEREKIPSGFLQPTAHLNNVHRFGPAQLAQIRRAYYACITELDTMLGRLFARLRELNLLHNTWIVFTSDHGEMLGDHGMGGKTTFLEPAAHIPLIIRPAGEWDQEPRRGTTCDELATLQDILPTCLKLGRVETPAPAADYGLDLLAAAAGEATRPRFIGHCGQQFGVIEDFWKYTCTTAGEGELLFDLSTDPQEKVNLAPAQPGRCAAMRKALEAELATVQSPALDTDGRLALTPSIPPEDVRRWTAWPGFHFNTTPSDLLH